MLEGPAGPAGLGGCSRERAGLVLNKRAPVDLVAVLRESAEAGGVRRGPWGYWTRSHVSHPRCFRLQTSFPRVGHRELLCNPRAAFLGFCFRNTGKPLA